jgi:hypothetical protein
MRAVAARKRRRFSTGDGGRDLEFMEGVNESRTTY